MSVLKPPAGEPEPAAAALIAQIRAYARTRTDDPEANRTRLEGMLHILTAVRAEVLAAFAVANADGPGKVSYRDITQGTGVVKATVQKYVREGRAVLGGAA